MNSITQPNSPTVLFEDTAIAFATKSDTQLRKTYWLFAAMNKSGLVNVGTFFIKLSLKLRLPVKNIIKATIFEQFCGGETISDCTTTIQSLARAGVGTILDYSVEGEDNEASFEATTAEILRTIAYAAEAPNVPFTVFKVTGVASTELLEKVQQGTSLTPEEQAAFDRAKARVNTLCGKAAELGVRIFIDAEESWIQTVIDQLAYEMMERYNKGRVIVYNTYQLYKHETLDELREAYLVAREKGYLIGGKLVRGAYMEKERLRAREGEYLDPIHKSKEESDADFNAAVDFCLDHIACISVCLGTHNEYSSLYCVEKMKKLQLAPNDTRIWFAQLLGMSDTISFNLAHAGYNVAKYVPYGPIEAVMPYLFRRAQENTSISGQTSRELTLVSREMQRRGLGSL
jgi:proline dehydrogenase